MSSDASSSYFSFTGAIRRFESIAISSAMIEFSHVSIKTKGVVETIWYLHFMRVNAFIFKIRVCVMCGSDDETS
jgi:hypothetical protein